jgi:acetate---CoA ligase (ADP-forming) subunit beta
LPRSRPDALRASRVPVDAGAVLAQARERGLSAVDEPVGKAILASFGISVPAACVVDVDEDVRRAVKNMSPPFVLKVIARGLLHKSDVGGVQLGLRDSDELIDSISLLRTNLKAKGVEPRAWLIEEMIPAGVEMVAGGLTDPEFGPMVMVGLGGIFVEVLKDVAFRICPISANDAMEMINELRGAPLLRGVRGREPVAIDAICDVLMRMGGEGGLLMQCAQHVAEVDINPLIVTRDRAVAADARFVLRDPA